MHPKPSVLFLGILSTLILGSAVSRAQGVLPGIAGAEGINSPTALRTKENHVWHVFGKVTTLNGDPVGDCSVRVKVANQSSELQALNHITSEPEDSLDKSVETNLQGEFEADFSLDPNLYPNLKVNLVVKKSGYPDARESVDFNAGDKTWNIDVILPQKAQGPDQLSLSDLTSIIGGRLRNHGPENARAAKDFEKGVSALLDQHEATRALPELSSALKRDPNCIACHLFYGLALLDDGSWAGGEKEFGAAAHLSETAKGAEQRPEPWILLGVFEEWRGQAKKAAGFFAQALKISPDDSLALLELGRTQVELKNWEAAEQYLARAEKAGAPPEARLLRVEALLGEGVLDEADQEMTAYLAGREIRTLPQNARVLYSDLHNRLELKSYGTVKSYVTQPIAQLSKAVPELAGLEPANDQSQLPAILSKVGEQVAAFFKSFPNTISQEDVRQERVRSNGKATGSTPQKFNYLLLATSEENGVGLEEYRTNSTGTRVAPQGLEDGFMLTAGFASTSLLLHPEYQSGAEFRLLGREKLDGRDVLAVAFAQRPETARLLERFNTNDASVILLVQGVAWMDATTYHLIRLRTDLLKPADKIRLERQTTEITYGEVSFKDSTAGYWLPHEVVVTVDWRGKTFRNLHEYSDFHLFNVGAVEKRKST